jgi:hypothetical protein
MDRLMGERTQNDFGALFVDLIEFRDRLLRAIGREESVQDREQLRERLVEQVSDTTEVLINEVLERFLRDEFGLTADDPAGPSDEDL